MTIPTTPEQAMSLRLSTEFVENANDQDEAERSEQHDLGPSRTETPVEAPSAFDLARRGEDAVDLLGSVSGLLDRRAVIGPSNLWRMTVAGILGSRV